MLPQLVLMMITKTIFPHDTNNMSKKKKNLAYEKVKYNHGRRSMYAGQQQEESRPW